MEMTLELADLTATSVLTVFMLFSLDSSVQGGEKASCYVWSISGPPLEEHRSEEDLP